MSNVFVDTDICLDLLSGRKPFNEAAARVFLMADLGKIQIFVSALTFANIDYLLHSQYSISNSRKILQKFKTLVNVLAVNDKIIELALASDFKDFEDAIQHYTAMENKIKILLTRNNKDYRKAKLKILDPTAYLAMK